MYKLYWIGLIILIAAVSTILIVHAAYAKLMWFLGGISMVGTILKFIMKYLVRKA